MALLCKVRIPKAEAKQNQKQVILSHLYVFINSLQRYYNRRIELYQSENRIVPKKRIYTPSGEASKPRRLCVLNMAMNASEQATLLIPLCIVIVRQHLDLLRAGLATCRLAHHDRHRPPAVTLNELCQHITWIARQQESAFNPL